MATDTKIQWTHHTFNPWSGCSKVHEGCHHCYAEVNYSVKMRGVKWGPEGNRVVASDAMWREPLKWNRLAEQTGVRRRVFCASLADIFEDWKGPIHNHHGQVVSWMEGACEVQYTMDQMRRRLFQLIDKTPMLDWQLLTKRPENIERMWPSASTFERDPLTGRQLCPQCRTAEGVHGGCTCGLLKAGITFRSNVWLGTSVSLQEHADKQIPELLKCRQLARILFVSAEPLLGPINFEPFMQYPPMTEHYKMTFGRKEWRGLDWIITGGESGPHSRKNCGLWERDIIKQCQESGVPVFRKQAGSNFVDPEGRKLHFLDKKGGDPEEWSEDLRVRQFPVIGVER